MSERLTDEERDEATAALPLFLAVTIDPRHRKWGEWCGRLLDEAEELRAELQERVSDIRMITAPIEVGGGKEAYLRAEVSRLTEERDQARKEWNCPRHRGENIARAEKAESEVGRLGEELAKARRTSEYWKAEHVAGNAEVSRLTAENRRLRSAYEHQLETTDRQKALIETLNRAMHRSGADERARIEREIVAPLLAAHTCGCRLDETTEPCCRCIEVSGAAERWSRENRAEVKP